MALAASYFAGEANYFLVRLPLWFAAYFKLLSVVYLFCGFTFWLISLIVSELRTPSRNATLNSIIMRLGQDFRNGHILRAVLLGLVFCAIFTIFTAYKPLVGAGGFEWDPFFAQVDSRLHGGRAPWEWLHNQVWIEDAAPLLDIVYKAFFLVVALCLTIFGFLPMIDAIRRRFVLTLLLSIPITGSLMAQIFSSAGPIYYNQVTGFDKSFESLRVRLAAIDAATPLDSVDLHKALWQGHESFSQGAIGISAFPSVHISVLIVCALAALPLSIVLSAFLWFWTLLTIIATIFLGWHYAIDAYASIAVAISIWYFVGVVHPARPDSASTNVSLRS
jgi:hypothetical protein